MGIGQSEYADLHRCHGLMITERYDRYYVKIFTFSR